MWLTVFPNLQIPCKSLFGYCGSSPTSKLLVAMNSRHFDVYREMEFMGYKYRDYGGVNDGNGIRCLGNGLFVFTLYTDQPIQSLVSYIVGVINKNAADEYDGEKYYPVSLRGSQAVYRIKDYIRFNRALTKVITLCRP